METGRHEEEEEEEEGQEGKEEIRSAVDGMMGVSSASGSYDAGPDSSSMRMACSCWSTAAEEEWMEEDGMAAMAVVAVVVGVVVLMGAVVGTVMGAVVGAVVDAVMEVVWTVMGAGGREGKSDRDVDRSGQDTSRMTVGDVRTSGSALLTLDSQVAVRVVGVRPVGESLHEPVGAVVAGVVATQLSGSSSVP